MDETQDRRGFPLTGIRSEDINFQLAKIKKFNKHDKWSNNITIMQEKRKLRQLGIVHDNG